MKRPNPSDFAVSQHLAALAHERYEVGITLPPKPGQDDERMMIRRWSAQEIERSMGFLKAQNARGSHIYIRPEGEHAYTFVDDLSLARIAEMKAAGFPPALVLESSPNNYQAWVAHGATLEKDVSTAVAKALAERFGGDPSSADWRHFGRLAGFTNRKPKHQQQDGRYPFVKVIESEGRIAPGSAALIAQVTGELTRQRALDAERRASYRPAPAPADRSLKSIDDFRNCGSYGGDQHRVDLAYATYALKKGVPIAEVESALRSRDLSHKGSARRQSDYVERTIEKAQGRGPSR
ncbi:DNA topoisomerase [Stenotrophomonas maltophilia]|nr:DNA topoisomerase [Stenotrophomonas maltophilia]